MKSLKFKYLFLVILSGALISAHSVRAADAHEAQQRDVPSLDPIITALLNRYPHVRWNTKLRSRFYSCSTLQREALLAINNSEKCIAILSSSHFNHFEPFDEISKIEKILHLETLQIPRFLRFPFRQSRCLVLLNRDTLLPFLQLNKNQFNEFQQFLSERFTKLVLFVAKSLPQILQIGFKAVGQLDNELFNNLIFLRSDQIQQLTELPFPQVEKFLKLDRDQRDSLPFDLDQFKAYGIQKKNLQQKDLPEVLNTSSTYQGEQDPQ